MYRKNIKASAVYHIRDSIEAFQFNISLRHIKSLLNLPKFDVKTGGSIVAEPDPDSDDVKVITIKWQEKLFSAHEIEFYRDLSNCITDVQKKYHQLILDDEDNSLRLSTVPIFTYVDEDNFDPKEAETVTENPLSLTDSTTRPAVVMYVYAALNPNTMLLSLRWQPSNKTLHIYPDFNSFRESPYLIEIDTDYRHLYAYGIENTSQQCRKGRDTMPYVELKLPEIPHWEDIDELSTKFAMPPKRTQRIVILLEIQRAQGFDYDDIHVRYYVRLPERTILEDGHLVASTHSSRMNGDGVSRFGHCWDIVLLCEEDFELGSLCHVYFEIISVDSWERERVEGYTHFNFFLEQGLEEEILQCHRPVEGSIMERLSRYFIGGRRKFDFEKFYGGDGVTEGGFFNRYGTSMVTTGTLTVRCQKLSQRNPELLRPAHGRMTGMTLEDIMKAYREARRRLEAVVLD